MEIFPSNNDRTPLLDEKNKIDYGTVDSES